LQQKIFWKIAKIDKFYRIVNLGVSQN